jgi:hypothetical protein
LSGSRIANVSPPQPERYSHKIKGVYLTLKIMGETLSGGYVNFSIFDLYGDPVLSNALSVCMSLALDIPAEDLKVKSPFIQSLSSDPNGINWKSCILGLSKTYSSIFRVLPIFEPKSHQVHLATRLQAIHANHFLGARCSQYEL